MELMSFNVLLLGNSDRRRKHPVKIGKRKGMRTWQLPSNKNKVKQHSLTSNFGETWRDNINNDSVTMNRSKHIPERHNKHGPKWLPTPNKERRQRVMKDEEEN